MYHIKLLTRPVYGIQYDGTNSADIAEKINDFTVVTETTNDLTFTSGGATFNVARNGHIVWQNGAVTGVFQNDDDFGDAWAKVAPACHEHKLVLKTGEQY